MTPSKFLFERIAERRGRRELLMLLTSEIEKHVAPDWLQAFVQREFDRCDAEDREDAALWCTKSSQ